MPARVVVYVDWQNCYHGARDAFYDTNDFHTHGQVDPVALGELLARKGENESVERQLAQVRVYTGRPDSTLDSRGYGAKQRQISAWYKRGAMVAARTLRYPHDYPASKPQEKGVDVALAIDFVAGAIDDQFDVGIVVSTDTDMRPALEFVVDRYRGRVKVETAAWHGDSAPRGLTVPGRGVWSHRLAWGDYESVADTTDYNIGPDGPSEHRVPGSSIGNR